MTTIAVIGATGTAGSRVVARLRSRDVTVVEISREHGIDLFSGRDLSEALTGIDVAIDVSYPVPPELSDISRTLAIASRNVVCACATREVQRLVVPTIAGIENPEFDGIPLLRSQTGGEEHPARRPGTDHGGEVNSVV